MGKKVLIITGSPRVNGNSNSLAASFAAGALATGNEVEFFDAAHADLHGCHADKSCEKTGFCGQKDDGVRMNELMRWADVLVVASPVYFGTFTSQVKTAIDRFYQFTFEKGRATIKDLETYLIAVGGAPSNDVFDHMVSEFAHVNDVLKFKFKGKLLCSGLGAPEAVKEHPDFVEMAVRMGMSV